MKKIILVLCAVSALMVAQDAAGDYKLTGVDVLYTYITRAENTLTVTDAYGMGVTIPVATIPAAVPFVTQPMQLNDAALSAIGINLNVSLNEDGSGEVAEGSYYPTPEPTNYPTPEPTNYPTPEPTNYPTPAPTNFPTPAPTNFPTPPTIKPTSAPTSIEDRKVKDPSAGDDGDSSVLIIAGVGCTLVILVLALIIVRRRRKRRRKSDETGIVAAYNNESGSSSRHPYLKPNVDINDTGFSNVSQQRNPAAASYEVDVDYASEDVNTGYSPEYGYGQNENAYGSSSMTESYDMSTNEKMGAPPPPTFPRMIRRRNSPFNVHDNEYGVDTSYNSYESSNTFSMENSDAPPAPPPAPHRQRNPVNQKNPANQRNFQDLEF